jgi:hypothetical protein
MFVIALVIEWHMLSLLTVVFLPVGIWLHGEGVPHEIEIVVTSDLAGTNE